VKRAVAVLAGTVAGLAALLSYKSAPTRKALGPSGQSALSGARSAPTPTAPTPTAPTAAPPTTVLPSGDNGGGVDDNGNPIVTTPPPAAAPPSTAAPAAPLPAGSKVVTGPDVPNRYGDVQVQVTLSGGKITDVTALQLPFDRQRSNEISQIAGPMLRSEVLQVQSANIDIISGATYTSQSYAQSVQAALDQARK
jgi:FMN-binding domain